ncbi:hypothetical protein [Pelagibius sp. Alg239-R121]|uniref:hypothetical protein n=1 Tax=Pelagibius sp. Alg239-R121 TaxID=2993448 RepID=UPI0024A6BED1|nr:hypothetical protein [Pelagibius sp. Alg239-R121]
MSSPTSRRSSNTLKTLCGAVLLSLIFMNPVAGADFHEIFETRCMECHNHAGDFAREQLTIVDGVLRGASGRDIAPFLKKHAGGLSPEETLLFIEVFMRQIESEGAYQERCLFCHDTARKLALSQLILRDGRLTGRYSEIDIASFLQGHARLSEGEAAEMTDALGAILQGAR